MENVYRREMHRERRVEYLGKSEKFSFKKLIIKQSGVCALILAIALFISFAPEDTLVFERNTIKFILTHNTDLRDLPGSINQFTQKYVFDNKNKSAGKDALLNMVLPLEGNFESPFGMRMHPTENIEKFHYGVDISAPEGEKIVCSQSGVAKEVSENSDYGKYIVVDHGDDIYTLYAHCSEIIAVVGDEIQAGQMIAKVGATGNVTGAHLHFEIKDGDNWLDPSEFIDFN